MTTYLISLLRTMKRVDGWFTLFQILKTVFLH